MRLRTSIGLGFLLSTVLALPAFAAWSITIEQPSGVDQQGDWLLTAPNSTTFSAHQEVSRSISGAGSGYYTLTVTPPNDAETSIQFYDATDSLLKTVAGTQATFFSSGAENMTIRIRYRWTSVLTVESDPSRAGFTLRNGTQILATGVTPQSFSNLQPGLYSVDYHPLRGCTPPRSQSRSLTESATLHFIGDYNCGTERPVVTPPAPVPPTLPGIQPQPTSNLTLYFDTNQSEVLPGGTVQVTLGVRNTSRSTLNNLTLTQLFNQSEVTLQQVLPQGGAIRGSSAVWDVPQLFAGQSWTVTYPVRISDRLKTGGSVHSTAEVSGPDVNVGNDALRSRKLVIGVTMLPKTGAGVLAFALFFAASAALTTTLSARRTPVVASTSR